MLLVLSVLSALSPRDLHCCPAGGSGRGRRVVVPGHVGTASIKEQCHLRRRAVMTLLFLFKSSGNSFTSELCPPSPAQLPQQCLTSHPASPQGSPQLICKIFHGFFGPVPTPSPLPSSPAGAVLAALEGNWQRHNGALSAQTWKYFLST